MIAVECVYLDGPIEESGTWKCGTCIAFSMPWQVQCMWMLCRKETDGVWPSSYNIHCITIEAIFVCVCVCLYFGHILIRRATKNTQFYSVRSVCTCLKWSKPTKTPCPMDHISSAPRFQPNYIRITNQRILNSAAISIAPNIQNSHKTRWSRYSRK